MERRFDVVIVGGDPAGCVAALQLAKRNPELAARMLLFANRALPRNECCGGGLIPHTDRLLEHLDTRHGRYRSRVVIGADGARSRVRRALVGPGRGENFVALETSTPEAAACDEAIFDFRLTAQGLRGYAWEFPCIVRGKHCRNRGIAGSRWPPGVSLRDLFAAAARERGFRLEGSPLAGWSAPLYHPDSPQGAAGVLLAGDVVGVHPWLGDQISMALGTGILAADAAADALDGGGFDFSDYTRRLRESAVGRQMERSLALAEPLCEGGAPTAGLAGFFAATG